MFSPMAAEREKKRRKLDRLFSSADAVAYTSTVLNTSTKEMLALLLFQ
jgi:hypothetical protein